VVVYLNIIGLLLYVFFAISKPLEDEGCTDVDLARRANDGRL
jgi:hypothetical protein